MRMQENELKSLLAGVALGVPLMGALLVGAILFFGPARPAGTPATRGHGAGHAPARAPAHAPAPRSAGAHPTDPGWPVRPSKPHAGRAPAPAHH
jgi:hypothetical protein